MRDLQWATLGGSRREWSACCAIEWRLGRVGAVNESVELLDYAERALDGSFRLGPRAARIAALLARLAFEGWLDRQSETWRDPGSGFPTTASELVVLETLQGAEIGERAKKVWLALSRAVHHHAYELQPSAAEVRYLVGEVRELMVS